MMMCKPLIGILWVLTINAQADQSSSVSGACTAQEKWSFSSKFSEETSNSLTNPESPLALYVYGNEMSQRSADPEVKAVLVPKHF
jgi:hypothetical protein